MLTNEHGFGAPCIVMFHFLMPSAISRERIIRRKYRKNMIVLFLRLPTYGAQSSTPVLRACLSVTLCLSSFSLKTPSHHRLVVSHVLIFPSCSGNLSFAREFIVCFRSLTILPFVILTLSSTSVSLTTMIH